MAQLVVTETSHLDGDTRRVVDRQLAVGPGGHPTVIATTTPTGHPYLSRAPNPP